MLQIIINFAIFNKVKLIAIECLFKGEETCCNEYNVFDLVILYDKYKERILRFN